MAALVNRFCEAVEIPAHLGVSFQKITINLFVVVIVRNPIR